MRLFLGDFYHSDKKQFANLLLSLLLARSLARSLDQRRRLP